jgi:EAL domain-containing protein (putative c-di-GMP-specific phosphodiesterase class I)
MDGPDGMTLVHAIVSMAQSLGLALVAEGIEHESQAKQLQELGCHDGQGFFFWRPMAAGAVDDLLDGASRPFVAAGLSSGLDTP